MHQMYEIFDLFAGGGFRYACSFFFQFVFFNKQNMKKNYFFLIISQDSYRKFGLGHVGLVYTKSVKHSETFTCIVKKQKHLRYLFSYITI